MTPEERQLLIQTHRFVEENNRFLRKMHRAALWGRLWHLFYWVVIIGVSVGAYYYIQPYVDQITNLYGVIKEDVDNVRGAVNQTGNIGDLLKAIGR